MTFVHTGGSDAPAARTQGENMNKPVAEFDVFSTARREFSALERWTYMDLAGRGVLSRGVRAAIDGQLDERQMNGGDKEKFFALIERARGKFAQLINADTDEVAYAKNISDGLNMVATAFSWQRGDNVILCPELEHPNNVYPWLNMQRYGLEVRTVKPRGGHIPSRRHRQARSTAARASSRYRR
jgi:cysteine desulfurase/selenocysteine lyase